MEGERSFGRSLRLAKIQYALHKNSDGLTSRELSELCGVTVRTIQRDLLDLQSYLGVPLTQAGDRYGIIREYALPPVVFSAYEATALFLACRLALRLADEGNPHIRKALDKISTVMPQELAGRLRLGIGCGEDTIAPDFGKVFEAVSLAWITQRQIKIHYLPLTSDKLMELLLEPYFVEMTGAGRSTYVIGHAVKEGMEGILSFSLDRIKNAEVLPSSFEAPSEKELEQILLSAWGTMWREHTEVRMWSSYPAIPPRKGADCVLSADTGKLPEEVHQTTLHISSWLEGHLQIKRTSELPVGDQLSLTSLLRHFDEHARRLWQSLQTQDVTEK
ncbi:MAG: WYL domain-containing protein [Chloroflexi bacterium]|nr:WYL domain-containing protein [Chloroflexota bacterium]